MMKHDQQSDEMKESDEKKRPTKRARFESESASTPPLNFTPRNVHRRTHRFLRLHLQLLRALYVTEVDALPTNTTTATTTTTAEKPSSSDEGNPTETKEDDPPLSNTLCTTIESFLQDRGRVQSLDTTVQHYRELYEDALDFMDEQSPKEGSSNLGSSSIPVWPSLLVTQQANLGGSGPMVHANNIMRQSFFFRGAQHSPFLSSNHLYHHHHPLQSTNPLRNSAHRVIHGDHHVTVKPFGLVAGLIQAKYQNSVDCLQETTIPFEPLITEVRKRIETLETLLLGSQGHGNPQDQDGLHHHDLFDSLSSGIRGVSRDYSPGGPFSTAAENDDEEERRARIETKIKLWKLLEMDLLNP
jgi:hypothetical protein